MRQLIDMTGKRYGSIVFIKTLRKITLSDSWRWVWETVCDCGVHGETYAQDCYRSGRLKGKCRHAKTHSRYKELYSVWGGMMQRCYNPKVIDCENYGGRGIKVCDRWLLFRHFAEDMPPRPEGLSIDRINNNGNYEPGNVRWATRQQQSRNTRRADEFTYLEGITLQRKTLLRYKRDHKCTACGKPLGLSKALCDKHLLAYSKQGGVKKPFARLLKSVSGSRQ
jgi:hypothetical protein